MAALQIQGSSSAGVSEQSLWAISYLSSDVALKIRLGDCGACEGLFYGVYEGEGGWWGGQAFFFRNQKYRCGCMLRVHLRVYMCRFE